MGKLLLRLFKRIRPVLRWLGLSGVSDLGHEGSFSVEDLCRTVLIALVRSFINDMPAVHKGERMTGYKCSPLKWDHA